MKRDIDLIRKVLLAVQDGQPDAPIEGYSEDEMKYHRALAIEAGLLDGSTLKDSTKSTEIPAHVLVKKLT